MSMGDIAIFWTLTLFAVFGLPYLFVVLFKDF